MLTHDPTFLNIGAIGARLTDDERADLELHVLQWICERRSHHGANQSAGGSGGLTGSGVP